MQLFVQLERFGMCGQLYIPDLFVRVGVNDRNPPLSIPYVDFLFSRIIPYIVRIQVQMNSCDFFKTIVTIKVTIPATSIADNNLPFLRNITTALRSIRAFNA